MPMTQADLPDIRRLASNGAFSFTGHASQQIISRGIPYDDVEDILTSQTNQIIECQSPSCMPGKAHTNERILLYDPKSRVDAIVVFCEASVECVGRKIRYGQHLPERGASPS